MGTGFFVTKMEAFVRLILVTFLGKSVFRISLRRIGTNFEKPGNLTIFQSTPVLVQYNAYLNLDFGS